MRLRRERAQDPMRRLVMQLRAAAANIHIAPAREMAAREARLIPQTFAERMPNTTKGKVARWARAAMSGLPKVPADERAEMAETLRGFATILDGREPVHAAAQRRVSA